MAQINIAARGDRSGAQRPNGDKVNGQDNAPMQPSVQRIARPPEAKSSRRTETPKLVSHTTRFNVPPPDSSAHSSFTQATWLRPLLVGLLLVALVPNITLAIVLWLGLIDPPWARHETPPPAAPTVQATVPSPVLTAPATLEAAAGETIKFPIALDNTDGVPARSIIAIQGLPPGSTLSDGRPYGDEWNLKSDQIGDLHLTLPSNAHGKTQIAISLIAANDTVITDTETVLRVNPAPSQPTAQNSDSQPAADDAGEQQGQAAVELNATDGKVAVAAVPPVEQTSAIPLPAAPPKEAAPVTADASPAEFVQPSAYVNLREGPSSSSRVVGVIARGAKVPVLDRKRGWVQVSNPATSEKGWIYGGYVGEGRHVRSRKKTDAAPEQKSDQSSSFWNWLTQ